MVWKVFSSFCLSLSDGYLCLDLIHNGHGHIHYSRFYIPLGTHCIDLITLALSVKQALWIRCAIWYVGNLLSTVCLCVFVCVTSFFVFPSAWTTAARHASSSSCSPRSSSTHTTACLSTPPTTLTQYRSVPCLPSWRTIWNGEAPRSCVP